MLVSASADDLVLPFQLESSGIRGRLVRLGPALQEILARHAYPQKIGQLLGETTALATALATALKFEGVFTLQTKSDGPVRMLVADVTSAGNLRATAQFDAERIERADGAALLGKGHLAFTVDWEDSDERYQGLVALEGETLAESVQHYFKQSEQLPTGLLAAARLVDGVWRGGCLMLQRMPREGGKTEEVAQTDTAVEDDWIRAMILMQTCTPDELVDSDLAAEELLFRLFHEEGVRVYEAMPLQARCRCSEGRVGSMLKSLPHDEVASLAVEGAVEVSCEFCGQVYRFDMERLKREEG